MAELKTALDAGEQILRESRANLQRGAETVGGHAYLTDRRLIFESHRFNIQRGATIVDLDEIEGVEKATTKFLGFLPIFPNSILIKTRSGDDLRLVLSKRGEWIAALESR